MGDNLTDLSLSQVSEAIRAQRVSSVAATEACLDAITAAQPVLNCFIAIEADDALAAARAADADIAAGNWKGPLHGVPLAHKDLFYRAGKGSTMGSRICRDHVPDHSATVIERLEAAGAVTLGRLNMSEFAIGPLGLNDTFGHCRNPWNTDYIAGGSSSGSGAAVAARLVFGAFGSDTGGSVRLPATVCGVAGIKPTNGLISNYGGFPNSWSLDTFGPLARTARDCAILLQAVAGPDARDPNTVDHPIPDYIAMLDAATPDLKGLRIRVPTNHLFDEADAGLRPALDESLEVLQSLGAEIKRLPMPDPQSIYGLADIVNQAELATLHGDWMKARPEDYNPGVFGRINAGFDLPATAYVEAMHRRPEVLKEFLADVFDEADVLLTPGVIVPTPTIASSENPNDAPEIFRLFAHCTRWVNYLGLPAMSVPCGFSTNGLPVAFQIVAPPFAEATLFTLADAYEGATDWHRRRPS